MTSPNEKVERLLSQIRVGVVVIGLCFTTLVSFGTWAIKAAMREVVFESVKPECVRLADNGQ